MSDKEIFNDDNGSENTNKEELSSADKILNRIKQVKEGNLQEYIPEEKDIKEDETQKDLVENVEEDVVEEDSVKKYRR